MSYQIKSTPFFRRMVSTSKKNGQLQKLKEEYERIKEFNDRTIEMKMRQVRLKRLFREIEEIKESSSSLQTKRRRTAHDRPKMSDEIRMETFVKSRELGKEYSKLNAIMVERCAAKVEALSTLHGNSINSDDQRKIRSEKRISYGNNWSRTNIQKLMVSPRKKPVPNENRASEPDKKRERLLKGISYGNALSRKNILSMIKRNVKHKPCSVNEKNDKIMPILEDNDVAKLHEDEEEEYEDDIKFAVNRYGHDPSYDDDAKDREWEAIRQMTGIDDDEVSPVEQDDDSDSRYMNEYELRTISNGTHLPKRENSENSDNSENSENSDNTSNEAVLSIEDLTEPIETVNYYSEPGPGKLQQISILPEAIQISEIVKSEVEPITTPVVTDVVAAPQNEVRESQVQKFVKLFEPYAHEVDQKKAIEYGTSKLRSIFEHQNN